MRIGIYDPYLDTLGGGEKYLLDIADCLSKENDVKFFWDDKSILQLAKERFGIDISRIEITSNIFSKNTPIFKKIIQTSKYDLIIYLSDGSIPTLFSKKNILLFQFPVNWVKVGLFDLLKMSKVDFIICYSNFVKKYLGKTFKKNIVIFPPAIDIYYDECVKKENIIVTVGRFTRGKNTKKQKFLINFFKKNRSKLKEWKLIVAGSYLLGDKEFVGELKELARGYPIEIKANISRQELITIYRKSKIYWHAAGFKEDLIVSPEKAEHFGITTLEAMGAGIVPIVFKAGGQEEIVVNGKNGFFWNDEKELLEKTMKIVNDDTVISKLSLQAIVDAKKFDKKLFCKRVSQLTSM